MDEPEVAPLALQALDRRLAPMGAAVVDYPEHPRRWRKVRSPSPGRPGGRRDNTRRVFTAPEDLRPVHVVRGEVGDSPTTVVLVLDA